MRHISKMENSLKSKISYNQLPVHLTFNNRQYFNCELMILQLLNRNHQRYICGYLYFKSNAMSSSFLPNELL